MRLNINLDEELIRKVDEVAKKMYVSRSAYISFALSEKLRNDEIAENFPKFASAVSEAVNSEKSKRSKSDK